MYDHEAKRSHENDLQQWFRNLLT